jgi:integrase
MSVATPELTLTALKSLTPSQRAEIRRAWEMEDAVQDRTYQQDTPLGPHVKRYLDYKRWRGLETCTLENREVPLRMLCLYYADRPVGAFAGREGQRLVEDFLIARWGEAADATKVQRASCVRDFLNWCYREGLLERNPVDFEERRRKGKRTRRTAEPREILVRLVAAQPRRNWRLGIQLLARQSFRKNDLRLCQLGHFDFANRVVNLFGKGAKEAALPLFPDLALELEGYVMERAALYPDDYRQEFLVFPLKVVRRGSYPDYWQETRERRLDPYTPAGLDAWFRQCRARAGIGHTVMHKLRHSAATEFHYRIARGDYELTRQFLRHEDIATTARYITAPPNHLALSVLAGDGWGES